MYLVDKELKKLMHSGVIKNASEQTVDSIAFDLHIGWIIGNNGDRLEYKELSPGETVIIATREEIELPANMVGFVIQKNSRLRTGISVNSPVYRPGHKTRVFVSVMNASANILEITSNESIAALMIEKLETTPEITYNGTFQNENEYKGLGNYDSVWGTHIKKIEDRYSSLKDLEKSIYGSVITLMTIFIGIFSLINFEVSNIAKSALGIYEMILYNLVYVGGLSALICLINLILPNNHERKWVMFIVPAVCILASLLMLVLRK